MEYTVIATFNKQPYTIVDFGLKAKPRYGVFDGEKELIRYNKYIDCLKYIVEKKLGKKVDEMTGGKKEKQKSKPDTETNTPTQESPKPEKKKRGRPKKKR